MPAPEQKRFEIKNIPTETKNKLDSLLSTHPDNITKAIEVANGAGMSPFELAIRRAAEGDMFMARDSIVATAASDTKKYAVMAFAYERAAENAEKAVTQGEDPQKGLELRQNSQLSRSVTI